MRKYFIYGLLSSIVLIENLVFGETPVLTLPQKKEAALQSKILCKALVDKATPSTIGAARSVYDEGNYQMNAGDDKVETRIISYSRCLMELSSVENPSAELRNLQTPTKKRTRDGGFITSSQNSHQIIALKAKEICGQSISEASETQSICYNQAVAWKNTADSLSGPTGPTTEIYFRKTYYYTMCFMNLKYGRVVNEGGMKCSFAHNLPQPALPPAKKTKTTKE